MLLVHEFSFSFLSLVFSVDFAWLTVAHAESEKGLPHIFSDHFQLLFFSNGAVFIYIPSPDCASVVNILLVTVVRGLWLKQKWRLEFHM